MTLNRNVHNLFLILSVTICTPFAGAAALTPGDILVTDSVPAPYDVYEYTPSGKLVQTFQVPLGPGESANTGVLRKAIVGADGNIEVYDGTFHPSLATVDPITRAVSYHQGVGFSTANNVTYGGVAAFGQYVWVSSPLVRFDTTDFSSQAYNTTVGYTRVQMGLDGLLYAITGSTGQASEFDVFNPVTMNLLRKINVPEDIRGIAVSATGDIYAADWGGAIDHFDSNGNLLKTLALSNVTNDIDLLPSGVIVASGGTTVTVTDTSLSSSTSFTAGIRQDFVSFIPVPEPSSLFLMVVASGCLLARAGRSTRRFGS